MMDNQNFTEDAKDLFFKYLQELRASLYESGLTKAEVEESVDDIYEHIVSNCIFRAGYGKTVTKDIVRKALEKLGDPEIIQRTLASELDFMEEHKRVVAVKDNSQDHFLFRAHHIRTLYLLLNAFFIFDLYIAYGRYQDSRYFSPWQDYPTESVYLFPFFWYTGILLFRFVVIPWITKSTHNGFLYEKVKLNSIHFLLYPYFVMNTEMGNNPTLNIFFVIYFISLFTSDGRRWISGKFYHIKLLALKVDDLITSSALSQLNKL